MTKQKPKAEEIKKNRETNLHQDPNPNEHSEGKAESSTTAVDNSKQVPIPHTQISTRTQAVEALQDIPNFHYDFDVVTTNPRAPEGVLAMGGEAIIYLVKDKQLGNHYALKVSRRDIPNASDNAKNLEAQGRLQGKLAHECNAFHPVLDIHTDEKTGRTWYVMPLAQSTLAEEAETWKNLPPAERDIKTLTLAIAMATALTHLETTRKQQNRPKTDLVHKDIKPSNVLFTNNNAKLIDICSNTGGPSIEHSLKSQNIQRAASFKYMSPEQESGNKADYRSDFYSLGMTLMTALAGDLPVRQMHIPPNTNAKLKQIVEKCTEQQPENRYQSAKKLFQELLELQRELNPNAPLQAEEASKQIIHQKETELQQQEQRLQQTEQNIKIKTEELNDLQIKAELWKKAAQKYAQERLEADKRIAKLHELIHRLQRERNMLEEKKSELPKEKSPTRGTSTNQTPSSAPLEQQVQEAITQATELTQEHPSHLQQRCEEILAQNKNITEEAAKQLKMVLEICKDDFHTPQNQAFLHQLNKNLKNHLESKPIEQAHIQLYATLNPNTNPKNFNTLLIQAMLEERMDIDINEVQQLLKEPLQNAEQLNTFLQSERFLKELTKRAEEMLKRSTHSTKPSFPQTLEQNKQVSNSTIQKMLNYRINTEQAAPQTPSPIMLYYLRAQHENITETATHKRRLNIDDFMRLKEQETDPTRLFLRESTCKVLFHNLTQQIQQEVEALIQEYRKELEQYQQAIRKGEEEIVTVLSRLEPTDIIALMYKAVNTHRTFWEFFRGKSATRAVFEDIETLVHAKRWPEEVAKKRKAINPIYKDNTLVIDHLDTLTQQTKNQWKQLLQQLINNPLTKEQWKVLQVKMENIEFELQQITQPRAVKPLKQIELGATKTILKMMDWYPGHMATTDIQALMEYLETNLQSLNTAEKAGIAYRQPALKEQLQECKAKLLSLLNCPAALLAPYRNQPEMKEKERQWYLAVLANPTTPLQDIKKAFPKLSKVEASNLATSMLKNRTDIVETFLFLQSKQSKMYWLENTLQQHILKILKNPNTSTAVLHQIALKMKLFDPEETKELFNHPNTTKTVLEATLQNPHLKFHSQYLRKDMELQLLKWRRNPAEAWKCTA
jgi:serine/threonine protein kinase